MYMPCALIHSIFFPKYVAEWQLKLHKENMKKKIKNPGHWWKDFTQNRNNKKIKILGYLALEKIWSHNTILNLEKSFLVLAK